MISWWQNLSKKVDEKTRRERAIFFILVLAVLYGFFEIIFFSKIETQSAELDMRLESAQKKMTTLSAQEQVLAQALTSDPNAARKLEIQRLENRLRELEEDLQALSVGLIAAQKLPEALRDVLHSIGSLKLVGMETVAPYRLQLDMQNDLITEEKSADGEENLLLDQDPQSGENAGVFKHSVFVSLEGKYFDVVSYMQMLEKLPWKFYWEALDYQVLSYPNAKVILEVYTLSTEEGVLGV